MAATPDDIVNQIIVELGYPERIGSIEEGSKAAIGALEVYAQCRDELLDDKNWPFARRANIPLALLKGPPPPGGYNPAQPWNSTFPPPGYLYEYLYPADCLTFRAVLRTPAAMFDLDPRPTTWRVDNDNSLVDRDGAAVPEKKVVLTNVRGAMAIYTAQIIDPVLWEPGFTQSLVERLQKKLAVWLKESAAQAKEKLAESVRTEDAAARDPG